MVLQAKPVTAPPAADDTPKLKATGVDAFEKSAPVATSQARSGIATVECLESYVLHPILHRINVSNAMEAVRGKDTITNRILEATPEALAFGLKRFQFEGSDFHPEISFKKGEEPRLPGSFGKSEPLEISVTCKRLGSDGEGAKEMTERAEQHHLAKILDRIEHLLQNQLDSANKQHYDR